MAVSGKEVDKCGLGDLEVLGEGGSWYPPQEMEHGQVRWGFQTCLTSPAPQKTPGHNSQGDVLLRQERK